LYLASVPAFGQAADPRGPELAAGLFEKARPHLEAVMGIRLDPPPRFRLPTTAEREAWDLRELEAQLHWQFPDLAGESFRRSLRATQDLFRSASAARYAEDAATIFVLPEQLPRMARWEEGLAEVETPAFLQLVLVQETARLLLDRKYDWRKRRAGCRDAEAFRTLQALRDGRAQSVTRRVARRLGTEAYFPLMTRLLLRAPDTSSDPALRSASQQALRQQHWACVAGLSFFEALEAAGMKDVESQVFAHPPRAAEWIDRPELFRRAVRSNRLDLDTVLGRLEAALPAAEWEFSRQPWTPDMVRQVADLLGEGSRAEGLLHSWEEGRLVVWTAKSGPARQVAVGAARFDSAAAARAYYGFAGDLQRKQEEKQGVGGLPRVVGSQARVIKLAGTDEAFWSDKRLQFGPGAAPVTVSILVVRAGTVVLEFTWHGKLGEPGWAEEVIKKVLGG
jgi:hypothetical protein